MASMLVTGVPRSGTTWLARLLALSAGSALAGREPMNPRGRQYALAGTLDGWARLTEPTARQRLALRSAYRGWNPLVYSRFGIRQWAGPLPGTRLVVKDPFAMLSMPAITRVTGAVPVLVYRHPGAVLSSYRRVGWGPDLDELVPLVATAREREPGLALPAIPSPGDASPAEEMGVFWSVLHELALADVAACGAVVVSHTDLATGGVDAGRALAARLGLPWSPAMTAELSKESAAGTVDASQLHNFDRAPAVVAEAWRSTLASEDVEQVERVAGATLAKVDAARIPLG